MNNSFKKAVLYLRVSTEEQVENFSLGTQEEICKREADHRGYVVDKIFRDEGKSAKSLKGRDALLELFEYCRKSKGEIKAVIFYKTDRLSRQIYDYLVIQQKLAKLGVKLISATEPTDETAMGKFLGNFFAQIAQFDNDIRSERSKNGMHARFRSGLYHNGNPPTGYLSLDKVVVKDPKTFDKIKAAWDLMATGTKSILEITKILNTWGVLLNKATIHRMFHSKFYMGILYSPTYQEEVQGQHTPMITKEQFDKVQIIINGRNPNKPTLSRRNVLNPSFPLRRFTKCGKCGASFTGASSKGRGGYYPYYFCQKRCSSHYSIPVKNIHEALTSLLKKTTINPAGKTMFLRLLENELSNRSSVLKQKGTRREQQLKKLNEMQRILIQKNLAGIYSDEIFKEQNELLEKNIKSIQTITDNKFTQQYNLQSAIEYVTKLMSSPLGAYGFADLENKRLFLSFLFPNGFTWNYPGITYVKINPMFK